LKIPNISAHNFGGNSGTPVNEIGKQVAQEILYNFLADEIVKMCPNTSNTDIVTQEDGVVCNHSISLEGLTHFNRRRRQSRYSNIQIHDRQTSHL
jgi:hypothetical protein